MATLVWGASGDRYFEAGVDRGVLYPKVGPGVPWNGLISVDESPTGAEARPYYYDGFKYLNLASSEEFEATINAYSAPEEFNNCEGTASINNGLFVTQQPREDFNFSYRTLVGNDIDGQDHGYKIHLVYNALAGTSDRSNSTLGDSADPLSFAWAITTAPPEITGIKPTAHFIIDSRKTPENILIMIEGVLYGSSSSTARMPSVSELMLLFS